MKVEISNWGPIEKCEFDLKRNLLVIFGDNNIGKSYAMQTLYLLLKKILEYTRGRTMYGFYRRRYRNTPEALELVSNFADNENEQEQEITRQLIEFYVTRLEQEWLPELMNSFENTFGTFAKILKEKPLIHMEMETGISCDIHPLERRIDLKMQMKPIYLKKTNSNFHKSRDTKSRLDIYVYENFVETPLQLIEQQLYEINRAFCNGILSITHDVYFLPASRSGIYTGMNSFGPILAQLSQNRAYIRGGIQIPSIPEPISDYYMELSTIKVDGEERFEDIANEIEHKVLKGKVLFDTKKKTITYTGENTKDPLEMSDVSSMVSEISPITAYLKYIVDNTAPYFVKRGTTREMVCPASIIFIEEPEAHLHPKNQVELVKIFAQLAKKNVKLIMASHSNYVFNELNNLVLGKDIDSDIYAPILMRQRGNKSHTFYMKMDDLGANDENFADVAEELYQEREELIQKIIREMQQDKNDTDN